MLNFSLFLENEQQRNFFIEYLNTQDPNTLAVYADWLEEEEGFNGEVLYLRYNLGLIKEEEFQKIYSNTNSEIGNKYLNIWANVIEYYRSKFIDKQKALKSIKQWHKLSNSDFSYLYEALTWAGFYSLRNFDEFLYSLSQKRFFRVLLDKRDPIKYKIGFYEPNLSFLKYSVYAIAKNLKHFNEV